MKLIKNS